MSIAPSTKSQEAADRFYVKQGPCCAGCDWWHHSTAVIGECRKSAPVAAAERHGMVVMDWTSWRLAGEPKAGHILTNREHHCGDFKDEFDWSSLPPHYLRKIGWQPLPPAPSTNQQENGNGC
jgi:hypothetical protein